jgi:hypothetical protein
MKKPKLTLQISLILEEDGNRSFRLPQFLIRAMFEWAVTVTNYVDLYH